MLGLNSLLRVGLIGLGRWGENCLNTLVELPDVSLARVAGRQHQRRLLESVRDVHFSTDWREVCLDSSLDALVVATPPSTQHEIVSFALDVGLPVLVEKPCTVSLRQCESLCNLSTKRNTLCMVDYVHLFSRGYQHLKSSISLEDDVRHIFTENFAPGPYREDVSVLLDWGCHDLAMCIDLLDEQPCSVVIKDIFQSKANPLGEVMTLELEFLSGVRAICTFGNGAEFKRRDFAVLCRDVCFVYDGLRDGLAMQFSIKGKSTNVQDYSTQPLPLECAINEFTKQIRGRSVSHPSLLLASHVHHALASAHHL